MSALTKTEWRKLLNEYRRLAIAENAVAIEYQDLESIPLGTAIDECRAIEQRIAEAPVDGLESLVGKLAIVWNADQILTGTTPGRALLTALDFLAEQTGWDPFMVYGRDGKVAPLPDDTEREGGGS